MKVEGVIIYHKVDEKFNKLIAIKNFTEDEYLDKDSKVGKIGLRYY